jgi:hypothetical protein
MKTQEELKQIITSFRNGDFEGCFCGRSTTNDDLLLSLLEELYTLRTTQPRSEVQWFSGEMERALRDNDYKRGWQDKDHQYLLSKLQKAIERIKHEINDLDPNSGKPCEILVIKEAVHAANYAMMIADNARIDR